MDMNIIIQELLMIGITLVICAYYQRAVVKDILIQPLHVTKQKSKLTI